MGYDRTLFAYQEAAVLSRTREQLVPLLYEHLLVSLRRAARHMETGEIEAKAEEVQKATDIICELLSSLDFEAGGDIAPRLASLYTYFLRELGEASRSLDPHRLSPLIEMVATLQESWAEAARRVAAGEAEAASPPAPPGEGSS